MEHFKCHICNKYFDQYNLEVHFVTYHNNELNPEIQCNICLNVFTEKSNLISHIKTAHKDEEKQSTEGPEKVISDIRNETDNTDRDIIFSR